MKVSMIVAMGRNRVIGADGGMPWHIPAELRVFKAITMGKPVVMGRRTFESIGRPLTGRANIVLTRDRDYAPGGVTVVHTPGEALAAARGMAAGPGGGEIMIIGGGAVYERFMDRADRLYVSEIDLEPEGDTRFPAFCGDGRWRETSREHHPAKDGDPAFDVVTYDRVSSAG